MQWETLPSEHDASVNHVLAQNDGGFIETRYVQRVSSYCICYLSSHTGCAHSCRQCHLTATGQTMMTPVTVEQYISQAKQTLTTYQERLDGGMTPAELLHFNFMARGEALSNPYFQKHSSLIFQELGKVADKYQLESKFLVSTIFPKDFEGNLSEILADPRSTPYYSLYSTNPRFRKRWVPKSWAPEKALDSLAEFQAIHERPVVLHWAFIKGENDSIEDVEATLEAVERSGVKARFNLVRYNPHDSRHGVESDEAHLTTLFNLIEQRMTIQGSRIVPRVGYDVNASCGMFLER